MTILAGLIALLLWKTFSPWYDIPVLEGGLTSAHQAEISVPVYTLKYIAHCYY